MNKKYCMGEKTKRPKISGCQKCAHLVRDTETENTAEEWIDAKTEDCPFFEKINEGENNG